MGDKEVKKVNVEDIISEIRRNTPTAILETPYFADFLQELKNNYGKPPIPNPNTHVKGAPVFELLSAALYGSPFPCEVVGHVKYVKSDGTEYYLFLRDCSNPLKLDVGVRLNLPLQHPECGPIIPISGDEVYVYLYDAKTKVELVSGALCLSYLNPTNYEKVETCTFLGRDCDITLIHTTFRCGVVATIKDVQITMNEGGDISLEDDVYLKVDADYMHGKFAPLTLFDGSLIKDKMFMSDTSLKLSKQMMSLPSYSTLILEVQLRDYFSHKILDSGRVKFEPADGAVDRQEVSLKHFCMKACLFLSHPYGFESNERVLNIIRTSVGPDRSYLGCDLVEVFSVFISNLPGYEFMDLYGNINVEDTRGSLNLFSHDKNSLGCKFVPYDKSALLLSGLHRSIQANQFDLNVDLKDKDDDSVFAKGGMVWNPFYIHNTWYDRRISSVIRGTRGYITIFYAIFAQAVQASLSVSISTATGCPFIVRGMILSSLGCFDDGSSYNREFFRSVLFARGEDTREVISSGSELVLNKSAISVPWDSSIVLHMDLKLSPRFQNSPGAFPDAIQREMKLEPLRNCSHDFSVSVYHIRVSVLWNSVI